MNIYMINDCFRVDGITGKPIEYSFEDDFTKYERELCLESGRNGYVSFQIIVEAENEKIEGIEIEFPDLRGGAGTLQHPFTAYIEWFHRIKGRLVPDALLPLKASGVEFRIPLDEDYHKNQKFGALWVDLFIPAAAQSGLYKGQIRIAANGSIKKDFEISVHVKNVILPDESLIYADLNAYADSISSIFPLVNKNSNRYQDGTYFEAEKEFFSMAYDHRCIFHYLPYKHSGYIVDSFAPELEGEGKNIRVKSWERFDRHFGPYLDGSAFKDSKRGARPIEFLYLPFNFDWPASFEKWGKKGYRTEFRRILTAFARHFEEKGWTNTWFELFFNHKKRYRFFPYDGDETRFAEDAEIMDIFHEFSADIFRETGVKFIFRTDSSWSYGTMYNTRFSDIARMWVASKTVLSWYPESVPVMKSKGNIVFIYGGSNDLDATLLSLFNWPMNAIMNGVNGFTLWNSTGFGNDDLKEPRNNGSEFFWYSGSTLGYHSLLPSIRLKVLRNSMQTADMMMTTEGMPLKDEMKDMVNRHYGLKEEAWWAPKPDFINEPPHCWTNAKLSDASPARQHIGRSPVIMEKIRVDVLRKLERK